MDTTVALITVKEYVEDEGRCLMSRVAIYGETFEEVGKWLDSYYGECAIEVKVEFIEGPLYLDKATYERIQKDKMPMYEKD